MRCPSCKSRDLVSAYAKKGLEIDHCPACQGVWLDKGEINYFTKNPKWFSQAFSKALSSARPSGKVSPETGEEMFSVNLPGGPTIDYCKSTGGLWFDGGEILELLEKDRGICVEYEGNAATAPDGLTSRAAAVKGTGLGEPLVALPNLFVRSVVTVIGLYALLIGALLAASLFFDLNPRAVVGSGVIVLTVMFLISPFLLDLQLNLLFKIAWVQPDDLPEHLRHFVNSVCQKKRITFPRFGILEDGAPQAFTYGHRPGNARIVISRGLVDLTEPDELEAVVAHEIGHAVHWDMFLMTVAQLVPLVLYSLYRTLIRMRGSGRDKSASARFAVAAAAYVFYLASEFVVLWFSRTREYHADRFAGEATGHPAGLARALIKVAYGLAGKRAARETLAEREEAPEITRGAVGAMGIFDARAAQGLAVTGYAGAGNHHGEVFSKEALQAAMRWDLWNPWARLCELGSTHPLVANRLNALAIQALHLGQEPLIEFNERRPESYWDEFLVDFAIWTLPWISVPATVLAVISVARETINLNFLFGYLLVVLGVSVLIRLIFSYPARFFPNMTVSALLGRVKVSRVRSIPCTVQGVLVGRGLPGYILSEDFVMRDKTGIIFLDYEQPLALWNALFGLLRGKDYVDQEATAEGWYRRFPVPYIELSRILVNGKWSRCWAPWAKWIFAFALVAIGAVILLDQPLAQSVILFSPPAGR